jgi:hypothetical protein
VHFVNDDPDLAARVHEIGAASVINYVHVVADWFDHRLESYRFAILPLSFEGVTGARALNPARRNTHTTNLLAYIERAFAASSGSADGRFSVAVRLETRIVGARSPDAISIKFGAGPDSVKVELTEDNFRRRWPHDYMRMVALVKKRVPGLLVNKTFHAIVKQLSCDARFVSAGAKIPH